MLNHDLVSVFLGVDARDILSVGDSAVTVCGRPYGGEVIYTGALDELFGFDLGALPYRTVDMHAFLCTTTTHVCTNDFSYGCEKRANGKDGQQSL